MHVLIHLSSILKRFAGGAGDHWVEAATVGEALRVLERRFPALHVRLENEAGERSANIYVRGEDIRSFENEDTPVYEGDEIVVVPAVTGG